MLLPLFSFASRNLYIVSYLSKFTLAIKPGFNLVIYFVFFLIILYVLIRDYLNYLKIYNFLFFINFRLENKN